MRKAKIAAIVIMCVVLAGCGMAIQVTHRPLSLGEEQEPKKLPGVPFYTRAVACRHKTVWIAQTYKLTLVGTQVDAKKTCFSSSMEITQKGYDSKEFNALRGLVDQKQSRDQIEIINAFEALRQYTYILPAIGQEGKDFDFLKSKGFILASNQNESFDFVDYTDPHYLNVKIPLAGSVNSDVTLNSDLTLAKVNVNVQEETLKTILSVLPVKELLSAAVMGPKGPSPECQPTIIKLNIEPQVYKYTLSTIGGKNGGLPCKNPADILHNVIGVTFTRELIAAEEPKKKDKEGNVIKFSGSVDLPKK